MAPKICRTCGAEKDSQADFAGNRFTFDKRQLDCRACVGLKITAGRVEKKAQLAAKIAAVTTPVEMPANRTTSRAVAKSKPIKGDSTFAPFTPVSVAPVQPSNAPVFVTLGDVDVALSSVALVDKSKTDAVEVVLNLHEVSQQGHVVAKTFLLKGADREAFLSSYSVATGKPVIDTRQIDALKAENERLQRDNAAALELAHETLEKINRLKSALN